MRKWCVLLWLAIPGFSFAGDGMLGTKSGGGSEFQASPASPVSGTAVIQLFVALAIVLLLVRYVLPKVLAKVNHRLSTNVTGGIRVEESASFAGGNLYVVTARSKTLLLSVTGANVSCLADLTEPIGSQPEVKTFHEMLEEAPGTEPSAEDPFAETLARLDRLDRLTQS